jgi:hypothetical protein
MMATPQKERKRTGKHSSSVLAYPPEPYWTSTAFQAAHEDHVALVDTHVPVGQCLKTDAIFKKFLVNVPDTKPSELATLADYQIPHGKLKETKGLSISYWSSNPTPPSTRLTLSPGPAKFRSEAYTLHVILDMIPTAKNQHAFHDYVPKHMKTTNALSRC